MKPAPHAAAAHQRLGAEVAVDDPRLAGPRIPDQVRRANALALVRILAGQDVGGLSGHYARRCLPLEYLQQFLPHLR